MSGYRLPHGGALIARDRPVHFRFDGAARTGLAGDTLASALLASGQVLVGRSFKYHRPRGVLTAGSEEPNALVTLRDGARREPNAPATMIELYDGLAADSQNRWPSLRFDLQAVNQVFSPLLVAGFYYKTFMGPTRKAWPIYERVIRQAAGMGKAGYDADPDRYERRSGFCDVLVVGAGAAGLSAALAAAESGASVILCDEAPAPDARVSGVAATIDGQSLADWTVTAMARLRQMPRVQVLTRTTVYGYYDGNTLGAIERVSDHKAEPDAGEARQRHWTLRPKRVVLATGATERPLVFAGNDIPGVMLADAARSYAENYGVAPGRAVAVFTNNDSGYGAALAMLAAGVSVVAVIDPRPHGGAAYADDLKLAGCRHETGAVVARAKGCKAVTSVDLHAYDVAGGFLGASRGSLAVDCLAVSGGWTPAIHLASQAGGKPVWSDSVQAFLPGEGREDFVSVGACAGALDLADAVAQARAAGRDMARLCGYDTAESSAMVVVSGPQATGLLPLWEVPSVKASAKKFVDFQHDVTASDLRLANREGYISVEHMKRYTTLGMANDQGKTSNVNAMAIMAAARQAEVADVGTTRFRPPYTPVSLGALAGRAVGKNFRPERRTSMHQWHLRHGAEMVAAGAWVRPRVYFRPGETMAQAIQRETKAVRFGVGICDVTSLGKIDIQGPDAGEFLNRVYINAFAKLPVGRARYGVMLRDDGIVYDDGTTWRLSEHQYLMTTTTVRAAGVLAFLETLLATRWPDLKVQIASVSDQWASMAVAGPKSRDVLAPLIGDVDFSADALPMMGVREGTLNGVPVLVARLSFSGENAYEVYSPFREGETVWQAIMDGGVAHDITPYGTEALGTLRIEKGHVSGPELDGRTTLGDLGLARMASTKKQFIGKVLADRPALTDGARLTMVGLESENGETLLTGSHLVSGPAAENPGRSLGHVTSPCTSPMVGKPIALALLEGGLEHLGKTFYATDPLRGRHTLVRVVAPCFFDPEGDRLHV